MCPDVASIPIRPSPGPQSVPSSAITTLPGPIWKTGAPSSFCPTRLPCPPVSEAPNPSITTTWGSRRLSDSFMDGDRMAPPEP